MTKPIQLYAHLSLSTDQDWLDNRKRLKRRLPTCRTRMCGGHGVKGPDNEPETIQVMLIFHATAPFNPDFTLLPTFRVCFQFSKERGRLHALGFYTTT